MRFYDNLPGYRSTLRDGGLVVTPPEPNTDSVLVMGTSKQGPLNDPKRVESLSEARDKFGGIKDELGRYNKTTLLPAISELIEAGCEDIRVMRVTGKFAAKVILGKEDDDIAKFEGKEPGTDYNNVTIVTDGTQDGEAETINFYIPKSIGGNGKYDENGEDPTLSYDLKDENGEYKSLKDLAMEINDLDENNKWITMLMPSDFQEDPDHNEDSDARFKGGQEDQMEGGDDELDLSKEEMYKRLAEAYEEVLTYDVDIVVPLGVYFDDHVVIEDEEGAQEEHTFAQQLANFCGYSSGMGTLTIGVISTSPLGVAGPKQVKEYYEKLMDMDPDFDLLDNNGYAETDKDGNVIDAGRYLNVIAGEGIFDNSTLGRYINTLESAYAGLISTLTPHNAPTNENIEGLRALRYEFSPKHMDQLCTKRYVTMRRKPNLGTVVTDGMTRAKHDSDYVRLTTLRITSAVVNGIYEVTLPFIGEAIDPQRRNAMRTEVKAVLADLQEQGMLQDYAFTVRQTAQERIQGTANILVEMVPAFELRRIMTIIELRPEL